MRFTLLLHGFGPHFALEVRPRWSRSLPEAADAPT